MSKLFYSSENNTHFLNMGSQPNGDSETTSVDVYGSDETDIILTDIEDHQNAVDEGMTYTDIMMESYNAISKEEVGSDSYKAVCALSQRILLTLPARLNLKRSMSMPSIEGVNYRYDVYDRIAKESIFEGIKKAITKVWDMIIGIFTSIINFIKRLLGIEIKKKEEETGALQTRIDALLKDKNKYKSVGGVFTGQRFSKMLNIRKDDIVKQGNITDIMVKLKDTVDYGDVKRALGILGQTKDMDFSSILEKLKIEANNKNPNRTLFSAIGDKFFDRHEIISYKSPLVKESILTVDLVKFKNSSPSYEDVLKAIDSSKLTVFKGELESTEIALETNIDNLTKLNDLFKHLISTTKETFDEGLKVTEKLTKGAAKISKDTKNEIDKVSSLDKGNYDSDFIKNSIMFINKFMVAIYNEQQKMVASINSELKYVHDFETELSHYIDESLEAFKPAN